MENNKNNTRFTYYATVTDVDQNYDWDPIADRDTDNIQYGIAFGNFNDVPPGTTVGKSSIQTNNIEMARGFAFGSRVKITIEKI